GFLATVPGPSHGPQIARIPEMRGRIALLELDRPLESSLRTQPVPIVKQAHTRARGVRLGEAVVDPYRRVGSRLRRREHVLRGNVAVVPQRDMGVSQPRVGQRIARIDGDRLLKVLDAFLEPTCRLPPPEVARLELKGVALHVGRARLD